MSKPLYEMTYEEELRAKLPAITDDVMKWDIVGNHCPGSLLGGDAPIIQCCTTARHDICEDCWKSTKTICYYDDRGDE